MISTSTLLTKVFLDSNDEESSFNEAQLVGKQSMAIDESILKSQNSIFEINNFQASIPDTQSTVQDDLHKPTLIESLAFQDDYIGKLNEELTDIKQNIIQANQQLIRNVNERNFQIRKIHEV